MAASLIVPSVPNVNITFRWRWPFLAAEAPAEITGWSHEGVTEEAMTRVAAAIGTFRLFTKTRGARRIDPDYDVAAVVSAIRAVQESGKKPTQERVGALLYGASADPRDSLKKQLTRIHTRTGIRWLDLIERAAA